MKNAAEPLLWLLLVTIVVGLLFGSAKIQYDKNTKPPTPAVSITSPVR